jgi:hypothetical protein
MKRTMLAVALQITIGLSASVSVARGEATGPCGWQLDAGISYFSFDPNLPNDLEMHNTHPDDRSFLSGSAGTTPLDEVNLTFLDLSLRRTWGIVKGPDDGWDWGLGYVLKVPVGETGRSHRQNENDYRPATEGSFIYTELSDVSPAHEVECSLRYWWFANNEILWAIEPAVSVGYWDMTFEKGWDRFGLDEAEQTSDAKGVSVSPQFGVSSGTRDLRLSVVAAYRFVNLEYDTDVLGNEVAQGWEVSGSVGWHF